MALSDDEFLAAFEALTLPSELFDHRGHLRLAWILLQRDPLHAALERVCSGIRAFAGHLGASQKYHHTLTVTVVLLMHARGAADPALAWDDFVSGNADLVNDSRGLVRRHYSDERLLQADARTSFVTPDRQPLPAAGEIARLQQ